MSTMNLPPVINPQYLDNNGLPLAGGSIYTYQAGTSTPQATYTDQGGGTPNTNPIVLDSSGRCSIWLDPSLSYKFIFKDSAGATIKTIDNVVGLLTADAVTTASIQDGAVTSAKLAAGAVNAAALESDGSVDANRPVNTNNIRNGAVTTAKIASGAVTPVQISGLLAPTIQTFATTGSGTYNSSYLLQVSSANATAGATYTISTVTYTVAATISSGNLLQVTGPSAPPASGTIARATGSGDASIAYTSFASPLNLNVRLVGAGGGGGGSGSASQGNGGTGGDTVFGAVTAGGGAGGSGSAGGIGGTASGTISGIGAHGADGSPGPIENVFPALGGTGGNGPWGGAGAGGSGSGAAQGATAWGAGGGGGASASSVNGGGGGGAGAYVEHYISKPSATYSLSIGTGGAGGTAGTSGAAGASGFQGFIIVEEHYQ